MDKSTANIRSNPWKQNAPPRRILVIRFQAMGDTVITLPYLQSLKRQYPEIQLDFLTREEVSSIPENIVLFDNIVSIGGGRNAKAQFFLSLFKLPWLWKQRYDAVLDLQNHKISRVIRKLLLVRSWAEFEIDINTKLSAGERTKQTIEALWPWKIQLDTKFEIRDAKRAIELLNHKGRKPGHDLVVLNPAGSFPSRNWPLENYVAFASLWLEKVNAKTQFVLLLLPSQKKKADFLEESLDQHCINLTGAANPIEAFAVLQQCQFVLSEDGGLMHMAWVQGIPTLALFSSSKKDWSAPIGKRTACMDSADMECGPCMQEICQFGDNRCLTRYTPDMVLSKAKELLTSV